jgi:hypothetical protein
VPVVLVIQCEKRMHRIIIIIIIIIIIYGLSCSTVIIHILS